jgi:hypothetical protein
MKKTFFLITTIFTLFPALPLLAEEQNNMLVKLVESLSFEKQIINARKVYDTMAVEQKYGYLQWWKPALLLSNDLIYPYKKSTFDDLLTSDTSSLSFTMPLPTGTSIDISSGYSLSRSLITLEEWGFSQTLQGKIGLGQSLNPWWFHTWKNPFKSGSILSVEVAKNDYNSTIKSVLYSCLRSYIALRKAERNKNVLNERIALYNDMLAAYQQMQRTGSISMREIQKLRNDKWEDEQTFFLLGQDIALLKNELYQITGIQVGEITGAELIAIDSSLWVSVFSGIKKEDIKQLEHTAIALQKNGLDFERLISRQNNAPFVKFEFGSSFNLPVQEKDALNDAWKKENFDDNELNNWSVIIHRHSRWL